MGNTEKNPNPNYKPPIGQQEKATYYALGEDEMFVLKKTAMALKLSELTTLNFAVVFGCKMMVDYAKTLDDAFCGPKTPSLSDIKLE